MTDHQSTRNRKEGRRSANIAAHVSLGLMPLLGVALAALAFAIAPDWHELPADSIVSPQDGSILSPPVVPHAGVGETAVPSATSVFTQPSYLAYEHVQSF